MRAYSDIRREPPTRSERASERETERETLAAGLVDLAALGDADLSRPEPYRQADTRGPDRARVPPFGGSFPAHR